MIKWSKNAIISGLVLILLVCISACIPLQADRDTTLQPPLGQEAPSYPETRFIVFSDPHIYDPSLGTSGSAFESYLNSDRKLLRESTQIMQSLIELIGNEEADFVLVPGDLTKDGELSSHQLAAGYLAQIKASGKKVYVVPGNHDINNGHSMRYFDDRSESVPNISAAEFAQIYGDFGYDAALYRDAASLSYVAELKPGLWLLALDACLYKQNIEGAQPVTDGKFNSATLAWIEDMLLRALQGQKAVIAMVHHGIVEHYKGQEKEFGDYLVDDYIEIASLLASHNVRLAFTGHYHAQDITLYRTRDGKGFIFDIETGSLVTWPCPYRFVSIDQTQGSSIKSGFISSIESFTGDFQGYANDFIRSSIENIAFNIIQSYTVKPAEAHMLAGKAADAIMAHYRGDEFLPPHEEALPSHGLSLPARVVVMAQKGFIESQWHDLEPGDNDVTLDLISGESK